MSALGHAYRWRISNTQNQAITVVLTARLWKYDTTGALVYASETTPITSVSVAATTGTTTSSTIDNSIVLQQGVDLTLSCTAAVTTNGTGVVAVYLERSTDGGTTWPTATFGQFVGAYNVTAADTTSARLSNHRVR
jgi:hypothetical protein